MAATIKDIAKALNISVSTVSYALNGGPRRVPDRVRDDVLRVAKELDYRPNRIARSLITGRTYTIGVVPSVTHLDLVLSPYLQSSLNGIFNEAELHRYDVLVFTRCDQTETREIGDSLVSGRVDALIFVAMPHDSPLVQSVRQSGIPYATVASADDPDAVQFQCDNAQGVRLAIEHLVGLGHRKIGHLTGQERLHDAQIRNESFLSLVDEFRLECRPEWIRSGEFVSNHGYEAAKAILTLPERPTALFCSNDEMALGTIQAAKELGLSVPEDLSVVGFDDVPLSRVVTPNLTTVRQPTQELAQLATRALIGHVEGRGRTPTVQPIQSVTLPNQLVIRQSTSRPKEDT